MLSRVNKNETPNTALGPSPITPSACPERFRSFRYAFQVALCPGLASGRSDAREVFRFGLSDISVDCHSTLTRAICYDYTLP